MKERPILFSAPMVRALLAGTKSQTRRIVKPMPKWASRFPVCNPSGMAAGHQIWWWDGEFDRVGVAQDCPYGVPGDALWVREAHALIWPDENAPERDEDNRVEYRADTDGRCLPGEWPDDERGNEDCPRWRPSIHMPRWASRITLRITDVRVERLNEISEADAEAEGAPRGGFDEDGRFYENPVGPDRGTYRAGYAGVWEHINGPGSWAANPWVWAVSFEVVK